MALLFSYNSCQGKIYFQSMFFLYYRSKEHAGDKSSNLPRVVMGGDCPRFNHHSSGSQTGGHPQNNRYGRTSSSEVKGTGETVFDGKLLCIAHYNGCTLHFYVALVISAYIVIQLTHKSYCIYVLAAYL